MLHAASLHSGSGMQLSQRSSEASKVRCGYVPGAFVALVSQREITQTDELWNRVAKALIRDENGRQFDTASTPWSFAISSSRWNGTRAPVIIDRETESWLAILGTWFHNSGASRPESILQQYLSVGPERLARELDGFYAVIISDKRTRETVVITDVVGSLHLYVRQFRDAVALSTSSLILASLDDVTLDAVGCQEFIQTGVMYEDRTLYNEVRKLPPATIIKISGSDLGPPRRYWTPASLTPDLVSGTQAADMLWEQLHDAVKQVNRQFQSTACDLTGGYDSRAVTAAFFAQRKNFTTVVSGSPDSPDVLVSKELSSKIGLPNIHYPPPGVRPTFDDLHSLMQLTDGECDLVEYFHVSQIHRDLSRQFDISVNGSFGEVARGYWWELLFPDAGARNRLDSHKLATRRYAATSCSTLFQPSCR